MGRRNTAPLGLSRGLSGRHPHFPEILQQLDRGLSPDPQYLPLSCWEIFPTFNSHRNRVPVEELEELDRWALLQLQKVITRVKQAYEHYDFHVVYHTLYQFCTNELSAFYLDILKDRLYTSAPKSRERRSAQTALLIILKALVRLMAPILSFTAEEIWTHLPDQARKGDSVHLTQFPDVDPTLLDNDSGAALETCL